MPFNLAGKPSRCRLGRTPRLDSERPTIDSVLGIEDLEQWAMSACLAGDVEQAGAAWIRAHRLSAENGDLPRAVRNAFWVAFGLLQAGEFAAGGGWLDRAQRMLDEGSGEHVEDGYLRFLAGLRAIFEGDATFAQSAFTLAAKIGQRFRDPELTSFALAGQGRCLIYLGEPAEGVALIDEALVAVIAGELSPIAAGNSYCVAIEGCQEVFDVRRAHEWTRALSDWCDSQPQMVLYRSVCLVHRAEIMVLHGNWDDAREALQLAHLQMKERPVPRAMGPASYLEGEINRLTGEAAKAEDAYRRANEWGREPQPGLALMRLQQGKLDAARATIRRVVSEARGPVERARVLEPYVENQPCGGGGGHRAHLGRGAIDARRRPGKPLSGCPVALRDRNYPAGCGRTQRGHHRPAESLAALARPGGSATMPRYLDRHPTNPNLPPEVVSQIVEWLRSGNPENNPDHQAHL